MARNNIIRVPPPTEFPLQFHVGDRAFKDLKNAFGSFAEAFDFLEQLPPETNPWNGNIWTGEIYAGTYNEKVWIPNNTFLHSANPLSVLITGGDDLLDGQAVVSVANGGLRNFQIDPQTASGGIPLTSLFVRDSTFIYSDEEIEWIGSLTDKTLKITPYGRPQEIFTFTATEIDVLSVAAFIAANGNYLTAVAAGGRVAIVGIEDPTYILIVDQTGTANSILGFPTTFDLTSVVNELEWMQAQNVAVVGKVGQEKAIWLTDRGGGNYVLDGILTAGGDVGIYAENNTSAICRSCFPFFHSQYGIYVGNNSVLEMEGGRSTLNTTKDVWVQPSGKLFARGNFAYDTRGGTGKIISSGARDSLYYAIAGSITTGNLDGIRAADYDMIIETVTLTREIAGNSGATIIQLMKIAPGGAATNLYTITPLPQIIAAQGDYVFIEAALPDELLIPKGNGLLVYVIQKEVGLPTGLSVKVRVAVTSDAGV